MNINKIIKKILNKRGFDTEEALQEYFSKKPKLTYDPFRLKGMEEAVNIIIDYAESGRRICIFGDYDTDGITSVAVMKTILSELTENLTYYIPSRFSEGYGLNMTAIDRMFEDGVELIITVDCGCTSVDEVAKIKELGMEIIVTDHHSITDKAADCIILNPKQYDDDYPCSFLCGCGVAFKVAQAISRKTGWGKKLLNDILDLVAIATIGDIVPLADENRTLVKYGMLRISTEKRLGLKALMNKGQISPENINSYNIAFGIVPRLNSSGRLKSADLGVELLTCEDEKEADKLANELNELNEERKAIQQQIFDTAVKEIDEKSESDNFIVYYAGAANEGVTGIVAGKLREKYNRPVIVLTDMKDSNFIKGTGRSIEKINLYELLKNYDNCFYRFGGHAGACGFTLYREHKDYLIKSLNKAVADILKTNPNLFDCDPEPDAVISASDISFELAEQIAAMEPFGEGNERPLFRIYNIHINKIWSMGKTGQYRKYICNDGNTVNFECIIFDSDIISESFVSEGDIVTLLGEISINSWNGKQSLQISVKKFINI